MRNNRAPTPLRKIVSALQRQSPRHLTPGTQPSHHIFCAGTYSPVFARMAAESALAACPAEYRQDFRLYIHVDALAASVRKELLSWLREIPGVEVSYGLFGILAGDKIPGKWHQMMINDTVREFSSENTLAFLDADLFLFDSSWWTVLERHTGDNMYALTVGMRPWCTMQQQEQRWTAMRTNLFTLNTDLHQRINQQRYNKDMRALEYLRQEFPNAEISDFAIDTQTTASLRAQALGHAVIDVEAQVGHCHIGGYSHLKANKFMEYTNPKRLPVVHQLLGHLRLLQRVIAYFDSRGWGRFVEPSYRDDIGKMLVYIQTVPPLQHLLLNQEASPREQVFDRVIQNIARHGLA